MPKTIPQRPNFTATDAANLARNLYNLNASAKELPSYDDQNFLLAEKSGERFVLKISNANEKREILDFQNRVMAHLAMQARSTSQSRSRGFSRSELGQTRLKPRLHSTRLSEHQFPRVCSTQTGQEIALIEGGDGAAHFVRLLTYLPGEPMAKVSPHTPELLHSLGIFLAEMDKSLENFSHPAMRRDSQWDLKHAVRTINAHIHHIADANKRAIASHFLQQFESRILPILPKLRASVTHNDANNYNLLVENGRLSGIIDFGDVVYTPTVFELAIAAAYAMLDKADPIATAMRIVVGYHQVYPLTAQELAVLYPSICARLCVSATMSVYQQKLEPDNAYLRVTEKPAWELLEKLSDMDALPLLEIRDGESHPLPNPPPQRGREKQTNRHQGWGEK